LCEKKEKGKKMRNALVKVKNSVEESLYRDSRKCSPEGIVYVNNDGYFVADVFSYKLNESQIEWSLPLDKMRGQVVVLTDDYEFAIKRHGEDKFMFRIYGTSMLKSFFREALKAFKPETLRRLLEQAIAERGIDEADEEAAESS
jgi:hypothetical protein